ncbi:hypothetical protein OH76DRAFT_789253 [Lentinus brumalis]|uniref:Uncharacterized protein n=1 Tax=Lentinus brumalis TaxID=2498619 RepID=A0A371D415_9APHY|nr:hypothetical protein OH76DRAFT_789253 [Polyporus brumalis]
MLSYNPRAPNTLIPPTSDILELRAPYLCRHEVHVRHVSYDSSADSARLRGHGLRIYKYPSTPTRQRVVLLYIIRISSISQPTHASIPSPSLSKILEPPCFFLIAHGLICDPLPTGHPHTLCIPLLCSFFLAFVSVIWLSPRQSPVHISASCLSASVCVSVPPPTPIAIHHVSYCPSLLSCNPLLCRPLASIRHSIAS